MTAPVHPPGQRITVTCFFLLVSTSACDPNLYPGSAASLTVHERDEIEQTCQFLQSEGNEQGMRACRQALYASILAQKEAHARRIEDAMERHAPLINHAGLEALEAIFGQLDDALPPD